jgi:arylsulfatase
MRRLKQEKPAPYRIQIQGTVNPQWADYFDGLEISVNRQAPHITTLSGLVQDQAALMGILDSLYNLGYPILTVEDASSTLDIGGKNMSDHKIVHDAEHFILEVQNREKWTAEDQELDAQLAGLHQKHGGPPNIIHIMWDDTAFGDIGIPALAAIRGFETPNLDRMRDEGIMFTRMYTEPACTPSRAAVITGRHPVRTGMGVVDWPLGFGGLSGDEVTTANVLSNAGYATAFYSKWHLGDVEESYCHNQGFDEAFFLPYNQVSSVWNPMADAANASPGSAHMRKDNVHEIDEHGLRPDGMVMTIDGKKDEFTREWGKPDIETYMQVDPESEKRMLEFITRNSAESKPFFISYWPNMLSLTPSMEKKKTLNSGDLAETLNRLDEFIGELMDKLQELGIAENTLLVCMADNGPMVHNPPSLFGMVDTIFRGGKGDFLEGGVRVPAFAWWPGTIEPGQIVNDMIHEVDLYTTFARLGDGMEHIPTDRVVDGVDQTSLLLNGDKHGRRDYVFIYQGANLGATVKGRYKRHWIMEEADTGTASAFFDLITDSRERFPQLVPLIWSSGQFDRMLARHLIWKEKYPDTDKARGIPFTGIDNARPETKGIGDTLNQLREELPFDPLAFIDFKMPDEFRVSGRTNAVD